MSRATYDAIIVGARVAGASTALLLACAGARVLLVDRQREIGDTLSTHALMRPAVELLAAWGLLDPLRRAGTPWVRQARFQYGPNATVVPIRPSAACPGLMAPRRWLLDALLVDAAAAAGADIRLGTMVEACLPDNAGRVVGVVLREPGDRRRAVTADLVVGADGRTSRVAACVGAETLVVSPHRATTFYGHFPGIPNTGYRWFFGDGVTAGAIPTNDDLHCVFAACRPDDYHAHSADPLSGMAGVLARFDSGLAVQVIANPPPRIRRFAGVPGHVRARIGEGWALVGDAAVFKDPATAHGITDAFLDAQALAGNLLRGGGLAGYQRARHAQSLRLFEITQGIASLDWSLTELPGLHELLNACLKEEHAAAMPCLEATI